MLMLMMNMFVVTASFATCGMVVASSDVFLLNKVLST